MTKKLAQYINHQSAPAIILRYPKLLYLFFAMNHFSVLRMKYTYRAIRETINKYGKPKSVIDAGCGMGDFLFTVPDFQTAENVVGIDVSPSNIEICNRLKAVSRKDNFLFTQADLNYAEIPPNQNMILCIGVIMYVQDDIGLLHRFRNSLDADGKLLLYVAVNYRRQFSFFTKLSKHKGFCYDDVIGRPHTYTDNSLRKKLEECGFVIESQRHSFGNFMAKMYEIAATLEGLIKTQNFLVGIFILPFFIAFYPFYLGAMMIDFYGSQNTGNGTVIVASKK